MSIREGKWKCEFCGSVNLGRDMKCMSCGAVRGENVKFFLDDDAAEVIDENLKNIAEGGADWHCNYCGTDNRSGALSCRQCGAPKEGMISRTETITSKGASGASSIEKATGGGAVPPMPERKRSPLPFILGGIAVIIIAATAFLILGGREDLLVLDDGEWNRSISIEQQEWVEYSVWENEVPEGVQILERWEEQRGIEKVQTGTEKVKIGTKDKGNGFFEDVYEDQPVYEEHPVFDLMVRYEIEEWKEYRKAESSGSLTDSPTWPDPALSWGDREGARVETAELYFHSNDPEQEGKIFTYDKLKPDDMLSFKQGAEYQVEVIGTIVRKFLEE